MEKPFTQVMVKPFPAPSSRGDAARPRPRRRIRQHLPPFQDHNPDMRLLPAIRNLCLPL
jgi:hypothetical protein